jgi:hypothetical protein
MVAVPKGRPPQTGWAAIRPVLIGFAVVADAFAVVSLAIVRPENWFAPFLAFGIVLVGMVGLELWAIGHRHDDE